MCGLCVCVCFEMVGEALSGDQSVTASESENHENVMQLNQAG